MLFFCFGPILIMSCLRRKDKFSLRYIFAFRENLGTRLSISIINSILPSVCYTVVRVGFRAGVNTNFSSENNFPTFRLYIHFLASLNSMFYLSVLVRHRAWGASRTRLHVRMYTILHIWFWDRPKSCNCGGCIVCGPWSCLPVGVVCW